MGRMKDYLIELEEQGILDEQCIKEYEADFEKLKQNKKWFNKALTWLEKIFKKGGDILCNR